MEWRDQHQGDRPELGQARQVQDRCELYPACRWCLLRFRSDQEKGRHRIKFPRAGMSPSLQKFCAKKSRATRWASLQKKSRALSPAPEIVSTLFSRMNLILIRRGDAACARQGSSRDLDHQTTLRSV